jgi:hypothetical protein
MEVGLDQKGAIRWRSKRLPPIINGVEIEFQIEIDFPTGCQIYQLTHTHTHTDTERVRGV